MQSKSERDENSAMLAWKRRLDSLQALLLIGYAVSLSLPITIPWIILIVGLVVWLAQTLISIRLKSFKLELPPLTVPILIFVAVNFISGAVNGGLKEALASVATLRTFVVYFWAYYVLYDQSQVLHEPSEVKARAIPAMLLLGAVAGVVATIQQLFNWHPGFKYLQGTGFLSGPMAFAGVMQMFSLMAIGLWLTGSYKFCAGPFQNRSVFIPIVIGNILGLLFAAERSAWFGFIIGVILIASLVSWKLVTRLIAVGIVVGAIGWLCVPMVQTRLRPLLNWQTEPSSVQRMVVWKSAVDQFQSSLTSEIIGVGPRKFKPIPIEGPNKQELDHAHSNYLQSLATTGVLGLCAYLWLCFSTLRLAMQNFLVAKKLDRGINVGLSLGVLGGIVSLLLAGIFEYNFGTGNVRLAQWFMLAMLASVQPLHSAQSERSIH
jgi:O-antigen ligase